jgi:hypothetical protein
MISGLTKFGLACVDHRVRARRLLGHQAAQFGCSVLLISSIERGKVGIPSDYVRKFSAWLKLSGAEEARLADLASADSKIIEFGRPKSVGSRFSAGRQ